MNNKKIIVWTGIIFVLGGVILYFSLNNNAPVTLVQNNVDVVATTTPATTTIAVTVPTPALPTVPKPKPVVTAPAPVITVPTPAPVVPAPPINAPKTFTLAEVASHNTKASCYTVVEGKVYDLTAFLSSHPAGLSKIMRGCGIDGTQIFNNVGAHNISQLSGGYLGLLK